MKVFDVVGGDASTQPRCTSPSSTQAPTTTSTLTSATPKGVKGSLAPGAPSVSTSCGRISVQVSPLTSAATSV